MTYLRLQPASQIYFHGIKWSSKSILDFSEDDPDLWLNFFWVIYYFAETESIRMEHSSDSSDLLGCVSIPGSTGQDPIQWKNVGVAKSSHHPLDGSTGPTGPGWLMSHFVLKKKRCQKSKQAAFHLGPVLPPSGEGSPFNIYLLQLCSIKIWTHASSTSSSPQLVHSGHRHRWS